MSPVGTISALTVGGAVGIFAAKIHFSNIYGPNWFNMKNAYQVIIAGAIGSWFGWLCYDGILNFHTGSPYTSVLLGKK